MQRFQRTLHREAISNPVRNVAVGRHAPAPSSAPHRKPPIAGAITPALVSRCLPSALLADKVEGRRSEAANEM